MKKIIIYPGGFQPFGPHHFKVYQWLQEKFGSEIFIATSNFTEDRPLNFLEKKSIIEKYGIDSNLIVQCSNVYQAKEILQNFNPRTDSVIFVYGSKDEGRISYFKKDGSPSYFKRYLGQNQLEPFINSGYVLIAPNFGIFDGPYIIDGTYLRSELPQSSPSKFKELMGWYDLNIHNLFKKKFQESKIPILEDRITRTQLQRIEQYADRLFKEYGIDIEFLGTHFFDRLNDPRNPTPITSDELRNLFLKTSRKYGSKISNLTSGAEGVLKDMESDINLPFMIRWDPKYKELDLIPKTIMKKPDFKTSSPIFQVEDRQRSNLIIEQNAGKYKKHIIHPYEATDLTFQDLSELIRDSLLGNLENVSLKLDGQNLQITFKDGEFKAARNKTTTINPMSRSEFLEFFKDRGPVLQAFSNGFDRMVEALQGVDTNIFNDGRTFINFEIINPITSNLFKYEGGSFNSIHSLITYDENGNEISRTTEFPIELVREMQDVRFTEKITLRPSSQSKINEFLFKLSRIQRSSELLISDVLGRIKNPEELQLLILEIGNQIIQEQVRPYKKIDQDNINLQISKLYGVEEQIERCEDENKIRKFQLNMNKLNVLGGLESINPIEGYVFNWRGMTMKWTGSFSPLNMILGLFRYSR